MIKSAMKSIEVKLRCYECGDFYHYRADDDYENYLDWIYEFQDHVRECYGI